MGCIAIIFVVMSSDSVQTSVHKQHRNTNEASSVLRQYILDDEVIVEGAYGSVFRARCKQTLQTVGVKRMRTEDDDEGIPNSTIREVALLKAADHLHIVKLLDICCSPGRMDLIFEYMPVNLRQFMKQHGKLECPVVRSLQHQLMLGIDFCHARRLVHRDLGPPSVLLQVSSCSGGRSSLLLKIADFGLARAFRLPLPRHSGGCGKTSAGSTGGCCSSTDSSEISSCRARWDEQLTASWCRAPELLLGAQHYGPPVDLWSPGCIFAEMSSGVALFPGDSEIDTIFRIFHAFGTPTEVAFPPVDFPDFKRTFPQWPRRPWADISQVRTQLGPAGTKLLDDVLKYDPQQRITSRRSLASFYFSTDSTSSPVDV